jgi:DNA-binding CsgD family transcriptional regulator
VRSAALLARVLDEIRLPVFVFDGVRQIYANAAGTELTERLRTHERIELRVVLVDHVAAIESARGSRQPSPTVTLLSSPSGEPFYLHVLPISPHRRRRSPVYAITVRARGADVHAFQRRYRLTSREGQITEFVMRGAGNREIAQSLGITETTTKKHLGRIFDKVGVDSRGQLIAKLG